MCANAKISKLLAHQKVRTHGDGGTLLNETATRGARLRVLYHRAGDRCARQAGENCGTTWIGGAVGAEWDSLLWCSTYRHGSALTLEVIFTIKSKKSIVTVPCGGDWIGRAVQAKRTGASRRAERSFGTWKCQT